MIRIIIQNPFEEFQANGYYINDNDRKLYIITWEDKLVIKDIFLDEEITKIPIS